MSDVYEKCLGDANDLVLKLSECLHREGKGIDTSMLALALAAGGFVAIRFPRDEDAEAVLSSLAEAMRNAYRDCRACAPGSAL